MRSRKRILTVLGCAALGSLFAYSLFAYSLFHALNRAASPLDRAQAIMQTATWGKELGNPYGSPLYYWSSGNELTYVGTGHDGTPHLFRRPGTEAGEMAGTEGPAVHLRGGYAGQVSPDGKWFVEWHQNKLRQRFPTFVAMDGTQRILVGKPTWGGEGIWTQGSDAMVSAVWEAGAALDRYDPNSGSVQKAKLLGLEHFYAPQRIDASGRMVGFEEGSFIMNLGKAVAFPARNYPRVKLARVDTIHPENKPEQWTVAVPGEIDHGTCLLSPSGDRILWILHGDTTPPLLRKLRSYIPGQAQTSGIGYRWLVSGLHGEEMHEIASYRYQPLRNRRMTPDPYSQPRWLPDGKHISFLFRNTLYVRPTD